MFKYYNFSRTSFVCLLSLLWTVSSSMGREARFSGMKFPSGRIAVSHDGNNYDEDDYLASAMHLALFAGLDIRDKLVHFDHSCHLKNKSRQHQEMKESVNGAVARFQINPRKVFDIQTQCDEAIANFKREAEKSTAENPLWFCIGGPMEVPWRYINAVDPKFRPFINCISHSSPFNERHKSPPEMTHDWDDLAKLGVVLIRIRNQNKTEWSTDVSNVTWMRDSRNPDLRWLYSRNAKKKFDCSDCGMLWWLLTGAMKGGEQNGGWESYRSILESLPIGKKWGRESRRSATVSQASLRANSYALANRGVVVLEAEQTRSQLGKWILKQEGLSNAATGNAYLEFTGNQITNGPADSPLEYTFRIKHEGLYHLHLRCARENAAGRKDVANDCYVRVEGNYQAGPEVGGKHGDHAPLEVLQKNTKLFGGDHQRFVWSSGNRLDLGGHQNKRVALYYFKAGETYKLVISGRSQKFKLDRIVFRHNSLKKDLAEDIRIKPSKIVKAN